MRAFTQYGPGDEATWPSCSNHPNDPRTPSDDRDPVDMDAESLHAHLGAMSNSEVIQYAMEATSRINDLLRTERRLLQEPAAKAAA